MQYTCIDCGKVVGISRLDELRQRCDDCNMTITRDRYQKNIPGGCTLFANTGDRLGHQVLTEVVLRYYKEQNPDEYVYYLTNQDTLGIEQNYNFPRAQKIFWAETSNIVNAPKDERVHHYYLAREAAALAEMGYYPKWHNFEMTDAADVSQPFILLHLRNVHNNPEKNVTEEEAAKVFDLLHDYNVYIVGNDQPFYQLEMQHGIESLRGILTINQTAWLCRHENCIAMIGKDSGAAHLAAASGAKVISWGYQHHRHWTPKGEAGRCVSFVDVNDEFDKFLDYIGGILKCLPKYVPSVEQLSDIPN